MTLLPIRFDDLFLQVLDMSRVGSLVILAVLLLRWLLRKAPQICSYVLWAVVLLRLLCPVGFESDWGVVSTVDSGQSYTLANDDISFTGAAEAAIRAVGDAANGGLGIQHIRTDDDEVVSSYWWEVWVLFGKYVWVAGMLAMLVQAVFSYAKLRKKLRLSMPLTDDSWANDVVRERPKVFLADGVTTAFVVGVLRPKIYLPSDLSKAELDYILRHERHHIKRGDHIWKLLGFLALATHWFNPLVWLAFHLAEKDMEMSCDEAVLKQLGPEIRKDYSVSLLRLATGKRFAVGIPLAFGEGDAGDRVRHVMKYKKPALWLTVGASCLALAAVLFLSANKAAGNTELLASVYRTASVVYSSDGIGGPTESGPIYAVSADHRLYRKNLEAEPWTCLGMLEPYALTKRELEAYAARESGWTTSYRLRNITDAYYLPMENEMFYLVFQMKNGHTLLAYGWEDIGERGQGASDDTSLTFLYRLEATGDAESTMGLTMTSIIGGPLIRLGSQWADDYCVWGFSSGSEYRDWGYAVFRESHGAFRLLDWHVYEDAALVRNQIYPCPDPAVLSEDGTMTNENTYDVILSGNEQLNRVVQTVTVNEKPYRTVEERNINGSSLVLLNWADVDAPKPHSVSRHFYTWDNDELEVSGLTQEELLWDYFRASHPEAVPLSWVLAEDGAQGLLGVVLFSEEPGSLNFAYVLDGHCQHASIEGVLYPGTEPAYEGNGLVSLVLEHESGVPQQATMEFSRARDESGTYNGVSFVYWAENMETGETDD